MFKLRAQRERYTQHPLTHGLKRQDFIHQQCGTVHHSPCTTTGTEAALFTDKSDQFFIMTGITSGSEESMFKSSAFQILVKFFCNVGRHVSALTGQFGLKLRPVLLNDLGVLLLKHDIAASVSPSVAVVTTLTASTLRTMLPSVFSILKT